jgi:two-component system sensor histidine kinase ChvG
MAADLAADLAADPAERSVTRRARPRAAVAGGAGSARPRARRRLRLNSSPLARKIISFNLIGLLLLVCGVFTVNPFRDSLVAQREHGLQAETRLAADVLAVGLAAPRSDAPGGTATAAPGPAAGDRAARLARAEALLARLSLPPGVEAFLFTPSGHLLAKVAAPAVAPPDAEGASIATEALNNVWDGIARLLGAGGPLGPALGPEHQARALVAPAAAGRVASRTGRDDTGATVFSVAVPVLAGGGGAAPPAGEATVDATGEVTAVLALVSAAGEIDALVRAEREEVLQMFVIAILVSIGLSLVLASAIANPLSDLATAAEAGRERDGRQARPGRVRIPDLSDRPDEIGRLSAALRGMVAALYDRIDANEQFAADVAHEIKNPLASLRSAVGTLRLSAREDQRARLCDVIEHDVRRLDRLVSDISNASRLDSELVKEEEAAFDLLRLLRMLTDHLGGEARARGVDFVTDFPDPPLAIYGLEERLAQVFVNLIENAVSFCEPGDAVRVWVRRRGDRVLVVVEDTGPGIPEGALTKVFERFYSERPEGAFGDHSGLGLAISRQIVEAHGGVIWAENIRPTDADLLSEPLGARFVVGLPV